MLIFICLTALLVSCGASFRGFDCSLGSDRKTSSLFCSCFVASFIALVILVFGIFNEPSAMDVYRGSTTLEITYRDSVPIDSTVIWKSNV